MHKSLKIAFLTSTDPTDKTAWSGIHFQMFQSLKKLAPETVAIGPAPDIIPRGIVFLLNRFFELIMKKRYNKAQNLILSWWYAVFFSFKLWNKKYDLLFVPVGSTQIAFLKTKLPIYSYGDTSFSQIEGYYPEFSNLVGLSRWESELIEKRAQKKADVKMYASQWAAKHVVEHYNDNSSGQPYVIPFGANIERESIPAFNTKKLNDPVCRLLFIGVDWERKGGQIALDTLIYLNNKGIHTKLTVIGCIPPTKHPQMHVIPFLNKNKSEDYQEFIRIFQESHFFILPTRAECAGIVYAEASAFSVPSLATNTGGVSSVVKNGENGFLFNMDASAEEYAQVIEELFLNKKRYLTFAEQARKCYLNELNWTHWGTEVIKIMEKTLEA